MQITPTNNFLSLQKQVEQAESPAALKKAAKDFETLFAHQLLETMQKDLEGQSLFGGGVEGNTIGAMAQWELAGKLASSLDLGIEQQLQAQLTARKGDK
jgi:Rod binding domain-containing protein